MRRCLFTLQLTIQLHLQPSFVFFLFLLFLSSRCLLPLLCLLPCPSCLWPLLLLQPLPLLPVPPLFPFLSFPFLSRCGFLTSYDRPLSFHPQQSKRPSNRFHL
ncbi:MAG: hypothetical protein J3R72DRAFT_7501 [Linnemannia gamsii]|nr:MAG: hypothetical protein J3R72DRAFT_7501 [Linnemannia gamsii]